MTSMIPQYQPAFGEEEASAAYTYLKSGGWITENKRTQDFEKDIAKAIGIEHASAVNNGTISLAIALLAMGVEPGDKVIVPNITMIATATAVMLIGATPVLCDIDIDNMCLELESARWLCETSNNVKAVIYVSLNGRSHKASSLLTFKEWLHGRGIGLIEDAAQSLGSKTPDEVFVGTIGDIGSFSFSPHKICSTGQGGCLVTRDPKRYEKIERLKDFGRLQGGADIHDEFGINSKFTDLQAVIGIEQLKKLPARIKRKNEIFDRYIQGLGEGLPHKRFINTSKHTVPWFVDIYTDNREGLIEYLSKNGVQTRPMYPALHTQKIFKDQADRTDLFVSASCTGRGLWLPSSFNLTDDTIEMICTKIKEFYK